MPPKTKPQSENPAEAAMASGNGSSPPSPGEIPGITGDPNALIYEQVARARAQVDRTQDPERRTTMERVQSAMEQVTSGRKELSAMARPDQLDVLEEVTIQLLDEDPVAKENIDVIKKARDMGREDDVTEHIVDQRNRYESLKREVAFALGIEVEDVEAQNEQYRAHMIDLVQKAGAKSEEEIMISLGFLVPDEETKGYRFNFPANLFPPHIVEKWKNYETLVGNHQKTSVRFDRALNNDPEEIAQLDLQRRYSHNSLAKDVQRFLHLEDWDFERCRSFVKKMVETRFPNVDTRESVLTSESVVNHLRAINALGTVIKRYHGDDEDDD